MKRFFSLVCIFVILVTLSACGSGYEVNPYNEKAKNNSVEDILVAENSKLRLEYNKKNYGVSLTDVRSKEVWGTSPPESQEVEYDEFGLPKERSYQLESVFILTYLEYSSNTEVTALSYDAVMSGKINAKKTENGIRVEYYLDSIKIMIPIEFSLCDDYLNVKVITKDIQESENKVIQIALAPFLCSAENDVENSYLFVPSGSGAIVLPKTLTTPIKTYQSMVYGDDYSMEKVSDTSTQEDIYLPVYGAKNGSTAICGIIENGAESAWISVETGDSTLGYSNVYAKFQMRGYTTHTSTTFTSTKVDSTIYNESLIDTQVSVRYYPLTDSNANYVGMADVYRNYLFEKYKMADSKIDARLNLTFLGGTMITDSFLGIPYQTLYPTTTVSQVKDIISQLSEEIDTDFSIKLKGFGESGVDIGKLAGGFSLSGKLGSKKDLKEFSSLCEKEGYSWYMDYDVLRYSKSSNGFSTYFDSIANTGNQKATQYIYQVAVKNQIEETMHYLLSPTKFDEVINKLTKKSKSLDLKGISLETLSNMAYSDYSDTKNSDYYVRNGFSQKAITVIDNLKKKGTDFMATKPNDYVAALSDIIIDSPTSSTKSYIFEYDIPFYQIVFKGYLPITVGSVNLSADKNDMILNAIESGCGINYTISDKWNSLLIDEYYPYFYCSEFSKIKDDIIADYHELSNFYDKIDGAHIVSHTVLNSGVRETVYDNGTVVYVNYSGDVQNSPIGDIPPKDYILTEKTS